MAFFHFMFSSIWHFIGCMFFIIVVGTYVKDIKLIQINNNKVEDGKDEKRLK